MRLSPALRKFIILLLALIPLATLFHHDDLGRWDTQRSAMAAPDEFSYLLMAQHFLQGGGLSLQATLGRDTFYPPGYPLLLALWSKPFGLSAFSAHALNTALLSACIPLVYLLACRILLQLNHADHRRFALSENAASLFALLVTALFATNWHVLETSLLIMSEPAFMLVSFAWLLLALKWPHWTTNPPQALALITLAVCAWSIRGAGIVCVAATLLFPILNWLRSPGLLARANLRPRFAPFIVVLALPFAYQLLLILAAPEKSLTSAEDSANSYPRQLLHGILIHGTPQDTWITLAQAWLTHVYLLVFGHLNDFAASFVPWPRENPDFHFRDVIGKIFAFFALAGFLFHIRRFFSGRYAPPKPLHAFEVLPSAATSTPRSEPGARADSPASQVTPLAASSGLLELYLILYITLYLIWPFNFARFWSPIFPVMLIFAGVTIRSFGQLPGGRSSWPRPLSFVLRHSAFCALILLLALSAVEDCVQLGNYARRLNYVSDSLAGAVHRVVERSDPSRTIVTGLGDDELFILAWYFSQEPGGAGASYRIRVPEPHLIAKSGRGEHADEMLLRSANAVREQKAPDEIFFFSYFPGVDARDSVKSFAEKSPADLIDKIYQKEIIVSVWQIHVKPSSIQRQMLPD